MSILTRQEIQAKTGYNITQCRKAAGMSRQQSANLLKLSYTAYARFEKGIEDITIFRLYILAQGFGVTVNDLIPKEILG